MSQTTGCFKYGCIGCLSICALGVALIFLVSAVNLTVGQKAPQPEQRELTRALPAPPAPPLPPEAPIAPEAVDSGAVEAMPDRPGMPQVLPLPEAVELPPPARVGTVKVDLSMGNFTIRPGAPGDPIRVEADYDAGSFELSERFTEGDEGWVYDLRFGHRGGGFFGLFLGGGVEGDRNRIELIVPRGQPIDLVGKLGTGQSKVDLGGLWLRDVDLELGTGDHFLELSEPLPAPMETFTLAASIGELEVRKLGDASPRHVKIKHRIGEAFVDLQGHWQRDADVTVDFGIGEGRLWLPSNARVELDSTGVNIGESNVDRAPENVPENAPVLTVHTGGTVGELRVEY